MVRKLQLPGVMAPSDLDERIAAKEVAIQRCGGPMKRLERSVPWREITGDCI
jgi:hypothetical protein